MIPESDIAKVVEATDLLQLAQRYARFRRSGKEWFACCIFHSEKTPSLSVNPSKQRFYCRGCHASGDVVGFIMRAEGLSFPQAVRLLAEQAGITIGDEQPKAEDDYVRAVAAEAEWFWREVRYRYAKRQALRVAYRNLARKYAETFSGKRVYMADQERYWVHMRLFRRFGRSAARWDRIIARLDATSKGTLLTRYLGIRQRHPRVANAYRNARELEQACLSVESRASGKVGALKEGQFVGLLSSIASRTASSSDIAK